MADPVTVALLLGGSIIVIGFLGNYVFERKGFPDMLLLILLGILLGPVTGLVDSSLNKTEVGKYMCIFGLYSV